MKHPITLEVNGEMYDAVVEPDDLLVDVIREKLDLTGTKKSCGSGECGSCTVLMEGLPVPSCLILAMDAQGKKITTIEGLSKNGKMHPLQESFVNHGAIQCGFCSPGMILSAKALLDANPAPTEEEIKTAISGNLCRCTGYKKIIEAISAVQE
jgi:aerobic carbon-monoxide dehydrogenase small subunit